MDTLIPPLTLSPNPNSDNVEGGPRKHYSVPQRAIFTQRDLESFRWSKAYKDLVSFVMKCNRAVMGLKISWGSDEIETDNVNAIVRMLHEFRSWIDDFPPLKQPMRFGNKAFRQWYARMVERAPTMVDSLLPNVEREAGATAELMPYLKTSFGDPTRIDFGTGHETNFVAWLFCLHRIGVLTESDLVATVFRCFAAYLDLMRALHVTYILEPAGSHGVWGLDDYHCVPFLWGSNQLEGNDCSILPSSIHDERTLAKYSKEYLYLGAISFIRAIKKGVPFSESSPMLDDISCIPTWSKINVGMFRLYEGEVLGKLPVVQHFLFGSILPQTWQVDGSSRQVSPSPDPEGFDSYLSTTAPWKDEKRCAHT